jgi:hypothetical protein
MNTWRINKSPALDTLRIGSQTQTPFSRGSGGQNIDVARSTTWQVHALAARCSKESQTPLDCLLSQLHHRQSPSCAPKASVAAARFPSRTRLSQWTSHDLSFFNRKKTQNCADAASHPPQPSRKSRYHRRTCNHLHCQRKEPSTPTPAVLPAGNVTWPEAVERNKGKKIAPVDMRRRDRASHVTRLPERDVVLAS